MAGNTGTMSGDTSLFYHTTEQVVLAGATWSFQPDYTVKYLDINIIGTGSVRYTLDLNDPATADHGKVLAGAIASPGQGGGFTYETNAVPARGISFYAMNDTIICIVAGRVAP